MLDPLIKRLFSKPRARRVFQIQPSWSYDADNEHHDYHGVKDSPSPAVELIDLSMAADTEDTRAFLLEEGLDRPCQITQKELCQIISKVTGEGFSESASNRRLELQFRFVC